MMRKWLHKAHQRCHKVLSIPISTARASGDGAGGYSGMAGRTGADGKNGRCLYQAEKKRWTVERLGIDTEPVADKEKIHT